MLQVCVINYIVYHFFPYSEMIMLEGLSVACVLFDFVEADCGLPLGSFLGELGRRADQTGMFCWSRGGLTGARGSRTGHVTRCYREVGGSAPGLGAGPVPGRGVSPTSESRLSGKVTLTVLYLYFSGSCSFCFVTARDCWPSPLREDGPDRADPRLRIPVGTDDRSRGSPVERRTRPLPRAIDPDMFVQTTARCRGSALGMGLGMGRAGVCVKSFAVHKWCNTWRNDDGAVVVLFFVFRQVSSLRASFSHLLRRKIAPSTLRHSSPLHFSYTTRQT